MTTAGQPFRALFNASNLHVGGGVQVATSVICEWLQSPGLPSHIEIWASTEVDANIRLAGQDPSTLHGYRVVDTHGLKLLASGRRRDIQRFDRVFTLFGPLYLWRPRLLNIIGFAQAWIVYPDNEISRKLSMLPRIWLRAKFKVQEVFFRRADRLIVELEHVAAALASREIMPRNRVTVIHNCLGSIYGQPARWLALKREIPATGRLRIGFVGRNYRHKNMAILPDIAAFLAQNHGLEVDFFVTFTESEWAGCSKNFRDTIKNVGPLSIAECPSFYQAMDAIIFPSLLECASATPLEAMAMKKPLFASDRQFNRDVCGEHAVYFDPLDPEAVALAIWRYFSSGEDRTANLGAARQHALGFSSAAVRAGKYLDILTGSLGAVGEGED